MVDSDDDNTEGQIIAAGESIFLRIEVTPFWEFFDIATESRALFAASCLPTAPRSRRARALYPVPVATHARWLAGARDASRRARRRRIISTGLLVSPSAVWRGEAAPIVCLPHPFLPAQCSTRPNASAAHPPSISRSMGNLQGLQRTLFQEVRAHGSFLRNTPGRVSRPHDRLNLRWRNLRCSTVAGTPC
jgi:hypothetical protein